MRTRRPFEDKRGWNKISEILPSFLGRNGGLLDRPQPVHELIAADGVLKQIRQARISL
jgi:hypothetical protein